nr:hypothetical protein [Mycobacterium sp. E3298]
MVKAFEEKHINEFKDKLNSFIAHEEQGIAFEKEVNPEANTLVRSVTIGVFKNILNMYEEHFNNAPKVNVSPTPPRNTGARRPGRPRGANKEAAAASEQQ